jgi:hypothetical protein
MGVATHSTGQAPAVSGLGGDEAHRVALEQMKGRWKHPVKGMGWYKSVKRDFAAVPAD